MGWCIIHLESFKNEVTGKERGKSYQKGDKM